MDWTTIITSLIAAIASAGSLGGIFHLRETKRAKRIENDKAAADEWKELYERSEKKSETLGEKVDSVYVLLRAAEAENTTLKVAAARAELLECRKTSCADRHPPLGSTLEIST